VKVLVIATAVHALEGGLERFNRRLVRSLAELQASGAVEGFEVISHWDTAASLQGAPHAARIRPSRSSILKTLITFIRLSMALRPDVILYAHVAFAPLMPLGWILRPSSRRILIVHGVEVWRRPRALRRWAVVNFARKIFSVSSFTARKMGDVYGIEPARFSLLPNALDVEGTPPAPEPAAGTALSGTWRLLSVTRLSLVDRYKNVDKVIEALPAILLSHPDTHYYIVGEGPWRPALEDLARSVGVERFVHFLGFIADSERDAVYSASHLFVLPSTGEGFGIVFLEAWRFGLPTIASNRDAASEVIRHGVDGLCVEPAPEAIADAVGSLLSSPERGREMGASGRKRLLENYTHEKFRERLLQNLREASSCAA